MNSKTWLFIVLIAVFSFTAGTVLAANEVIDVTLDKNMYALNESIIIDGALYSSAGIVSNTTLSILLNNVTTNVTTDSAGTFTTTLNAPNTIGEYPLVVSYLNSSVTKTIIISPISDIRLAIISSAAGSYKIISLSTNKSAVGITSSGSIAGTRKYGNFTHNSTTYYMIAQLDENTQTYDDLFISTTNNFSNVQYQYIGENSKIGLGGVDFNTFYIDPAGNTAILLRQIEPLFYGTGSEWAGLFVLALNSTDSPISDLATVSIEHINDFGIYENLTNETTTPSDLSIRLFLNNAYQKGYTVQNLLISTTGGMHQLIVGDIAHISYFVQKFTLTIGVETLDGSIISTAQKGQTVVLRASVVDADTGVSTDNATVTARVIDPTGIETPYPLLADANKIFRANVTLDDTLTGEYTVFFKVVYANSTMKKNYVFTVKSNNLFMEAFSPEKGEGSGFPTNSEGFLIISGRDLSTNEFINLSNLTNDCDETLIYLSAFNDEKNVDHLGNFTVSSLTQMLIDAGAPLWVKNEMNDMFGANACAIRFTTPPDSGTYMLELTANVSGSVTTLKEWLDVTTLFAWGTPVNCATGGYAGSIAPGARVCIKTNVYDAATGREIASANITELNIIEVYSQSDGVITDEISNITAISLPGNSKGISFTSSNATLGDHSLKFRVKVNTANGTATGTGSAWFRTELWTVWAYPYCSGNNDMGDKNFFCNFGSTSNVTMKVEAYSAGFSSGKADLTVETVSIKNWETGETITLSASGSTSCTTLSDNSSSGQSSNNSQSGGVVRPATCTITIPAPDTGWPAGGYELKLTATDTLDNSMTIYSGFMVQNFMFWIWNKNWEMSKTQNGQFEVTIRDFANNDLNATITLTKAYYMGSDDNWMQQPKEISITATPQIIDGQGTFTINASAFAALQSGFYDLLFTATTVDGTQTSRTGMSIRSFVTFANNLGENWEHSYEIDGNMTINITAFDSVDWSTWPPTGTGHNITHATVTRINKNGMWDKAYKTGGAKNEIVENVTCTANNCLLTVDLTGFEQSSYDMQIEVSDNSGGSATTNYWFKTESYTITVPEIQDWRIIPAVNRLTEKMDITLSTDQSCGTSSDNVIEPTNVTNCLYDNEVRLPTIYDNWDQGHNIVTVFLLDKTNSSNPKVYVNYYNDSWTGGYQVHANFSNAAYGPLGLTSTFTDTNGYLWQITAIDVGLGKITLRSVNGVIRTRTKSAGTGQGSVEIEYSYQYLVNKSLSKSGVFLFAGNKDGDNEDKFWDDQWANIDLDDDGKYNCNLENQGNPSGPWVCEEYVMLLIDRVTNGTYDTLLMSPSRNMSAGVDSYNGFSGNGAGDIKFNSSADPVYLLNIIYSETNGIGSYRLVTTTNKAGWPGKNLGIFQLGSTVKIPVMIASPSTKAGIANKTVAIRTFQSFGKMDLEEVTLPSPALANTSSNGIALLSLNMSGVLSGEYSVVIEVQEGAEYITSGNEWDNPKLELRSFSISNLFGQKGNVGGLVEWSTNANNLFRYDSVEGVLGSTELKLRCEPRNNDMGDPNICHVDDWRFRELWVNMSNSSAPVLLKDPTMDDWRLQNIDITGAVWNLSNLVTVTSDMGGQITYRFSNASIAATQLQLSVGNSVLEPEPGSSCDLNITLVSVNTSSGSMIWTVQEQCPWSSDGWDIENNNVHYTAEERFLWGLFNISTLNDTGVVLNEFKQTVTLSSPIVITDLEEGNDGRVRVLTNVNGSGYDLYIYNSNNVSTRDDLDGRSGMLDTVLVVNSANRSETYTYRFGQAIAKLNGKAVVSANPWQQYVYLSNLTLGGNIVYPLPWSCDGETYYLTTFTEQDIRFKLYDCNMGPGGSELSARPYYIILFDDVCDGTWSITRAKFDDDPVLDDSWVNMGSEWGPYDYDHAEGGEINNCAGNPQFNMSENGIDVGRESYPFTITSYNIGSGILNIFKNKQGVNFGENITTLSLWVQAKNFDGSLINGNITVEKATGTSWDCGIMQEEDINVTTSDGIITSGVGYLDINLSAVTSSQPTIKFKIIDSSGENGTKYESVTKSFWYAPGEQNNGGSGGGSGNPIPGEGGSGGSMPDCGGFFKGGDSGGGFGGGGPGFDDEFQKRIEECGEFSNTTLTECENNDCIWIVNGTLGLIDGQLRPAQDTCAICGAFDDFEAACSALNETCTWIPAGFGGTEGTGACDPLDGPGAFQ
ncbi:MAG: hypothetical protein WC916_07395 [Candidatus Woesearchaeota archaeon]